MIFYLSNFEFINEQKVLSGDLNTRATYDTEYNKISVYNMMYNGEKIRIFNTDAGYSTLMNLDKSKINTPVSEYIKLYDIMFKLKENINNVLMIGGAGYSYPRHFITSYKDIKMDVVEIDEKVNEVAKKFFYLDELVDDWGKGRINLIVADGRNYLNNTDKKYDIILNDAFSGKTPARVLSTIEANNIIKNSLTDGGAYITNIIGGAGKYSGFLYSEIKTLKEVYKNVYVIPCDEFTDKYSINNIVIATDVDCHIDSAIELDIPNDTIVLTDNYSPVEALSDF